MRPTCLALSTLGCAGSADPPPAPTPAVRPVVVTLSPPVDGLVAALTPPGVIERRLLLDDGADPPDWRPSPEQIAAAARADLVVASGAGFEAWTAVAALPAARFVDASAGLSLVTLPETTHQHGDDAPHSHSGPDPHVWLDPVRYAQQAATVHGRLARLLPEHQGALGARLVDLEADLKALDGALADATAPLRDRPLAANHPTFTYWTDRYGLTLTAFDVPPEGPVPEAAVAWAAAHPDGLFLWEAAPTQPVAAQLAVAHVVLDPLEAPGPGGAYDYAAQARANVAALQAAGR